jgi:hypothetical protein
MRFLARRAPQRPLMSVAAGLFLVAAFQGCGGGSKIDHAEEEQAKEIAFVKENLAKLAGRVSVDGQPPAENTSLVVILNDPEHLDATAGSRKPKLYSVCGRQGEFALMTKPGKYILTFVQLHQAEIRAGSRPVGRGLGPGGGTSRGDLIPPDELKNLYNDPDKNAKVEAFQVDLKLPGKDDYQIDLAVAGKDPAPTSGPNAVTRIMAR